MVTFDECLVAHQAQVAACARIDSARAQLANLGSAASTSAQARLHEELEEAADHLKTESARVLEYLYALQGRTG